jgi:hypothetical protein
MWIDIVNMTTSFQTGQVVINLPVYMLDRIERDYSDLASIMSSNLLKIDDFYTYYTDNELVHKFYFSNTGNAAPVAFQFDDIVAGYTMPISVQIGNSRNEAMIPFKP